jgi:hypothetical protein
MAEDALQEAVTFEEKEVRCCGVPSCDRWLRPTLQGFQKVC